MFQNNEIKYKSFAKNEFNMHICKEFQYLNSFKVLTSICRVEIVVNLKPLDSSSDRVLTPSLMSAPDIFQLILAAGLPPFDIHVRLSLEPSAADNLPLESASTIQLNF